MPKQISILHVIDHLGPGGAQVVLRDFVGALQNDFRMDVAVLGQSGIHAKAFESNNVPVFNLGANNNRWDLSSFFKLDQLIASGDYDIVHAHLHKSSIFAGFAAQRHRRRFIVHDHTGIYDPFLTAYIGNKLLRKIYLKAFQSILTSINCVLVLNQEMREKYLSEYRIPDNRVRIIPNSVDLNCFTSGVSRTYDLRETFHLINQKIVLMAGRLEYEKDWDTFLRVSELLTNRMPVAFIIVGSGSEQARLQRRVEENKINNVYFLGYRTDIPNLLAQSDVFLLTSRQDACPVVLLEAMAARRAVVSTRTVGAQGMICEGKDGLLANIGDAEGLATAVERFLGDPVFAQQCGHQARLKVERDFSLAQVSRRLSALYLDFANL